MTTRRLLTAARIQTAKSAQRSFFEFLPNTRWHGLYSAALGFSVSLGYIKARSTKIRLSPDPEPQQALNFLRLPQKHKEFRSIFSTFAKAAATLLASFSFPAMVVSSCGAYKFAGPDNFRITPRMTEYY
jgi:hypothetical protein